MGTGAKATLLNSVALGTASKTDKEGKAYVQREIMGETYTWAGGATTDAGDVVSVGSKAMNAKSSMYPPAIFLLLLLMPSMALNFMVY